MIFQILAFIVAIVIVAYICKRCEPVPKGLHAECYLTEEMLENEENE